MRGLIVFRSTRKTRETTSQGTNEVPTGQLRQVIIDRKGDVQAGRQTKKSFEEWKERAQRDAEARGQHSSAYKRVFFFFVFLNVQCFTSQVQLQGNIDGVGNDVKSFVYLRVGDGKYQRRWIQEGR